MRAAFIRSGSILAVAACTFYTVHADKKVSQLDYFNIKGFGELPRIIGKVGKLEIVDERIPFYGFKNGGPDVGEAFPNNRAAGKYDINMGRVPVLSGMYITLIKTRCIHSYKHHVVGDTRIGQSGAIERYLARKAGLMGSSDEEAAIIECIVENVNDIKGAFRKIRDLPNGPDKDSKLSTWYATSFPEWLGKLEKSLPSTVPGSAVGEKLSYADIVLWHLLNEFFKKADIESALKSSFTISIINDKVSANPELQKWISERPVTPF